jgi:hypothetical protein
MQPESERNSQTDGLEASRRRWNEEKARGEWHKAALRQAEREHKKAKPSAPQPEEKEPDSEAETRLSVSSGSNSKVA